MSKEIYSFLEDYVGLKIKLGTGVDLYALMTAAFLTKFDDNEDENNRAEAGRMAYRVMRGLQKNGLNYAEIMKNGQFFEIKDGREIDVTLNDGITNIQL